MSIAMILTVLSHGIGDRGSCAVRAEQLVHDRPGVGLGWGTDAVIGRVREREKRSGRRR